MPGPGERWARSTDQRDERFPQGRQAVEVAGAREELTMPPMAATRARQANWASSGAPERDWICRTERSWTAAWRAVRVGAAASATTR